MDELLHTIINHEGSDKYVYQDTNGFWTIGVGRCVDRRCDNCLSPDEISFLLSNDIKRCASELANKPFYIGHDCVRQEVLIELVFNLGLQGLETFKNFLNSFAFKHYSVAADEIKSSLWAKEVHSERVNNICYRIINGKYP